MAASLRLRTAGKSQKINRPAFAIRPFARRRCHPSRAQSAEPKPGPRRQAGSFAVGECEFVAESTRNPRESAPLTPLAATDRFQGSPSRSGLSLGVRIVREEPANANDQSAHPQAPPGPALEDQNSRAGRLPASRRGGPAVFSVGHAHPEVNAAISRQLEEIAYGYRYLFTSAALESLTETLLRVTGNCYQDVIYTADGSEAVESALKVALTTFRGARLDAQAPFHRP